MTNEKDPLDDFLKASVPGERLPRSEALTLMWQTVEVLVRRIKRLEGLVPGTNKRLDELEQQAENIDTSVLANTQMDLEKRIKDLEKTMQLLREIPSPNKASTTTQAATVASA